MNLRSQGTASAASKGELVTANDVRVVIRDAAYITLAAAVLAFTANALRPNKLPLIAKTDFEILVPCPEPLGSAETIKSDDARIADAKSLLIDARSGEHYADWHLPSAISVPFDWLAEQDQITSQAQTVARSVARSKKHAVVVYGDGGDPDSGQQWAALLTSAGIRNVTYVVGGATALRPPTEPREQP